MHNRSNTSDDELMVQGANGDQSAFRVLVERWQNQVFAFLLRMLGSPEDAQDLCQETFIRMIRSADKYQPQGQFQSWLFRIAGNQARSRLRRQKIVRWIPWDSDRPDPPSTTPDPYQQVADEETRQEVSRAIDKLPPRQKEALLLKQYQGLRYKEIAETMGLTVSSVQMLLHRAMLALKDDFSQKGSL